MSNGTVRISVRPIKLAFVIDPADTTHVLEAIRINSFLWGGIYNPILPYHGGVEGEEKVLLGYLDNYDPDYVVTDLLHIPAERADSYSPPMIAGKEVINAEQILQAMGTEDTPTYGLGLFDILESLIEKELKFHRRKPLNVDSFLPELGDTPPLFLAGVFGNFHQEIDRRFRDSFEQEFGTERLSCTLENYVECLSKEEPSLMEVASFYKLDKSLSSVYLNRPVSMDWWGLGSGMFFLDAESSLDMMDFWNLRASGWDLIAIPKQISSSATIKRFVSEYIEKSFGVYTLNHAIYRYTTLFKSRSTSTEDFESFANAIQVSPPEDPGHSKLTLQPSYPRIWEPEARYKDGVECCEIGSRGGIYQDVVSDNDWIAFKSVAPEFYQASAPLDRRPRFANEIELQFFREKDLLAEVIPEGGDYLRRIISGVGGQWRLSKKGIVVMSPYPNEKVSMTVPRGEKVFTGWLKEQKWDIRLSDKGYLAKQIFKQVGGTYGLSSLANEDLIALLERMNTLSKSLRGLSTKAAKVHKILVENGSAEAAEEIEDFLDGIRSVKLPDEVEGKALHQAEFWAEIQRIAIKKRDDPKQFLKHLMELRMFRLGVKIQCSICTQKSWYSIAQFDYELQCPKCTENFLIDSYSPEQIAWAYRTFGPFSLPNQAYGAYSVLLTFRFFSLQLQSATTPMMSFEAQKGDTKIEADIGLFARVDAFRRRVVRLVFAECKTYNDFTKNDADRMVTLGEQFPDAIFCFATFKTSLDEREKGLIRKVADQTQGYEEDRRQFKPILILTNSELFSNYHGTRGLPELCEKTQSLYLA